MDTNQLAHYGILGMRWGVRRSEAQLARARGKRDPDSDDDSAIAKPTKPARKAVKDMSDEELVYTINRLQLEKRYKDLIKEVDPPKIHPGRDYALNIVKKIGEQSLVNIGTQAANKALGVAINKAFKVDSYDDKKRIVNPNKGQTDKK